MAELDQGGVDRGERVCGGGPPTRFPPSSLEGRWSKELAAGKDKIIGSKDAEIAASPEQLSGLKDFVSPKSREYFTLVRTNLEEFNDLLKTQLARPTIE